MTGSKEAPVVSHFDEGELVESARSMSEDAEPSPYDRWRNYQPASLARTESADPLDVLSEPVTPIPHPAGETHAGNGAAAPASGAAATPAASQPVPELPSNGNEPVRHSPFVAEDEIRAVVEGGLKSDTLDTQTIPAVTPTSVTVNAEGVDIAPSRKLDSPDMLRWRAEMLLDEMMVGAVDSSAGEGNWRGGAFSESAMLDDHPRLDARGDSASSASGAMRQAAPATQEQRSMGAPDPSPVAPENPASAPSLSTTNAPVPASVSAGVRAALPPRSASRMPTPIVRDPNGSANGSANGASHTNNGHTSNGASSKDQIGYTLDALDYGVADDGRPLHGDASQFQSTGAPGATPARPDATDTSEESTGFILTSRPESKEETPAPTDYPPASRTSTDLRPTPVRPVYQPSFDPLDTLGTDTAAYSTGYAPSAPSVRPQRPEPQRPEPVSATSAPSPTPNVTQEPIWERPNPYTTVGLSDERNANEQTARRLTAVEQRYPRATPPAPQDRPAPNGMQSSGAYSAGMHNDAATADTYTSGLGPVRINPAVLNSTSITGAMAVGSRANSRYASLLPRATPWDLHEMEREIVSLQEEMARVLPSGHESSRRAHHLLEKAQSIFNGDPLRSAEVDYYLTQVRAIVQRSRQTMQWSENYRHQLERYHKAWILFSGLMLTLGLLFGDQLANWAIALLGLNPTGLVAAYVVPALIAMFAGSLGASIGALVNIRRYHRLDLGYFDRKYSLRGLVLPVIGILAGVAFAALFGSLYWVMGTTAPLPLVLELLPAILAFALGFLQESIYGTRE